MWEARGKEQKCKTGLRAGDGVTRQRCGGRVEMLVPLEMFRQVLKQDLSFAFQTKVSKNNMARTELRTLPPSRDQNLTPGEMGVAGRVKCRSCEYMRSIRR